MPERPLRRRAGEAPKARNGRASAKDPGRKSLRWGQLIEQTSASLRGHAKPIHIADREADIYLLLAEMTARGDRFVVRARVLERIVGAAVDDFSTRSKLREVVRRSLPVTHREVQLRTRRKSVFPAQNEKFPPREGREGTLEIAAETVRLTRPREVIEEVADTLDVNVVQ